MNQYFSMTKLMCLKWIFVLALACVGQTTAMAAPRIVYQGTLQGAGEVVMELDRHPASDGTVSGRYFYARYGVDVPLRGTPASLVEPLARTDLPDNERDGLGYDDIAFDHPAATWRGVLDGSGYRGRWVDARSGVTRNFALHRVAEYDPDGVASGPDKASGGIANNTAEVAEINPKQAPYETLKLAGHAQPVGHEIGDDVVAYQMWRDPRTRLSYPRLSRYPDPAIMARINHLLEQRHWQLSLAALDCVATRYSDDGPSAGTLGGIDDEIVQVTWLSTALLGLSEAGSIFCGGAHPDNHYNPYTFDLLRGEYLDWNRVIKAYVQDNDGIWTPDTNVLRFIEQRHSALAKDSASADSDCTEWLPQYLALAMQAPDKLSFVVSDIGHAMGACLGPQIEVKLNALSPILKPDARRYLVPSVKLR
jgi:hypothetical protein